MVSTSVSRPFPGFDDLYHLASGPSGLRGETDWPESGNGEEDRRLWLGLLKGGVRPSEPVPVRYAMGRSTPGDIVWTTNLTLVIVHMRVVDTLLDHGLTGWGTYPVEVHGKEGEFFPDYVGFSITGRCGPIDGSRSKETPKEYPGGIFPVWVGVYFAEDSWDGSDFFMTTEESNGLMFATEDVARAFKQAKVKGARFQKLSTMELCWDPNE
jgi:hypothetical protein